MPETDAFGNPIEPRGSRPEVGTGPPPPAQPAPTPVPPPSGMPGQVPPVPGSAAPPPSVHTATVAPALIPAIVVSVLGWFCCWIVGQLAGTVLCLRVLRQVRESGGTLTGRGVAIALLVLNDIVLLFWILILATGTWHITDHGIRFHNP